MAATGWRKSKVLFPHAGQADFAATRTTFFQTMCLPPPPQLAASFINLYDSREFRASRDT
jgi:hypothetical protein